MNHDQSRPKLLLRAGAALVLTVLASLALGGRPHAARPAQDSQTSATAGKIPPAQGFVSHSSHFTLTAEIHAGS